MAMIGTGLAAAGTGAALKTPRSFGELWEGDHPIRGLKTLREQRRGEGR